jgi:hypothetical protein
MLDRKEMMSVKNLARIAAALAVLMVSLFLFSAARASKDMKFKEIHGTWIGLINGENCSKQGMSCKLSQKSQEEPVFVPIKKGKPDYTDYYVFRFSPFSHATLKMMKKYFLQRIEVTGNVNLHNRVLTVTEMPLIKWKKHWHDACCTGSVCCPRGRCCLVKEKIGFSPMKGEACAAMKKGVRSLNHEVCLLMKKGVCLRMGGKK